MLEALIQRIKCQAKEEAVYDTEMGVYARVRLKIRGVPSDIYGKMRQPSLQLVRVISAATKEAVDA